MVQLNGTEALSNEEVLRYSRHLILPDVGLEGQRKQIGRASCRERV